MKKLFLLFLAIFSFQLMAITEKQKSDLVFMYQEEKLARDVYTYFSKIYDLKVFGNIAKSEQNHMEQIETLLKAYKIPVPKLKAGEFSDKELNTLYDKLIKQGKTSEKEALKVGILIEDKDIADLKEKIKNSPDDIKFVYSNLLKGSENHKKAFSK
jgi:hypothetical protein